MASKLHIQLFSITLDVQISLLSSLFTHGKFDASKIFLEQRKQKCFRVFGTLKLLLGYFLQLLLQGL
jgi:hypothetical protein